MNSKPKQMLGLREFLHLNRRIEELKNLQSATGGDFYLSINIKKQYKSKKINPLLERFKKKETWV